MAGAGLGGGAWGCDITDREHNCGLVYSLIPQDKHSCVFHSLQPNTSQIPILPSVVQWHTLDRLHSLTLPQLSGTSPPSSFSGPSPSLAAGLLRLKSRTSTRPQLSMLRDSLAPARLGSSSRGVIRASSAFGRRVRSRRGTLHVEGEGRGGGGEKDGRRRRRVDGYTLCTSMSMVLLTAYVLNTSVQCSTAHCRRVR